MIFNDFVNNWQLKINNELLKSFPSDFFNSDVRKNIKLHGKPLIKGSELFGNYEIIDIDGNSVFSSENIDEIKYILYANRTNPASIEIVEDRVLLSKMIKNYEAHLDNIIKNISEDFKLKFPKSNQLVEVSNRIFNLLNLQRH